MWNEKFLACPAISTYKTLNNDIDLQNLLEVCGNAKKFFEDNEYMEAEYLVLSRIVYRMKQKFRTSKDFKTFEKVYKCLKTYFSINLTTHLQTFMELVPAKYRKSTYLPSKNLLDYILVRLQGIAKLLEKTVINCEEAAYLLNIRIKSGHFWKVAFIISSIISRIHHLAKYITRNVCEFYDKLVTFSKKLQSSIKWLREGYTLPDNLKEWLNVSWIDSDVQLIEESSQFKEIIKLYDLVEDSDIEICDEYILIDEEEKSSDEDDIQVITPSKTPKIEEDVGTVLEINDSSFVSTESSGSPISLDKKRPKKSLKNLKGKKKKKLDHSSDDNDDVQLVTTPIMNIVKKEIVQIDDDSETSAGKRFKVTKRKKNRYFIKVMEQKKNMKKSKGEKINTGIENKKKHKGKNKYRV